MEEPVQNSVLSVEELNRQIRQIIEGELGVVWVRGELSNFKAHTSGHFYFSLKDSKSQINAVMFRGHNSRLKFKPRDGLEVIIRGRITVYEPRGNYQITCEMMEPVGAGALQKAYEDLKEKLKAEGLFDSSKKRPIPTYPQHVAIITSPTGAAIRDILNVLSRRNKTVKITLVPSQVQGEAAVPQIVEALTNAYRLKGIDAIIIGRGGGSVEDMWCFNDEQVARMIAKSPVPIISAVGHEIDFTIADFVADLRAPTPSAAAELVVKNTADLFSKIRSIDRLLTMSIQKILKIERQKLNGFKLRLIDPKRKLQDLLQRNDELFLRMFQSVSNYLKKRRLELTLMSKEMTTPEKRISNLRSQIEVYNIKIRNSVFNNLESSKMIFKNQVSLLESLSPLKVVERGYSMALKGSKLIKSVTQVNIGDELTVKISDGELITTVNKINEA